MSIHKMPLFYRPSFVAFGLFIFSVVIYAGSLKNDFVWDDEGVFLYSPAIQDLKNIPSFFLTPYVMGAPVAGQEAPQINKTNYYRPLTTTVHSLEYRLFGTDPFGYKLINLICNGLVVVCAFLLVRDLSGGILVPFLATVLYAANPARGEAVYWAYSDSYIFAALFSLLAIIAYHRNRPVPALLSLVVALLFLETAILVLPVLFIYQWLLRDDHPLFSRP